jgi:DNA polymerase-3 subunit beta
MDQATVDAAMNMAALRDKEERPEAYAPSFAGVVAVPDEPTKAPTVAPIPTIERATLRAMLEGALITTSKDATRPHLAAVLFELCNGTLRLVSTDGHRLTRTEAAWSDSQNKPTGAGLRSVLVPVDRAVALLGLIKKPAISKSIPEHVTFELDEVNQITFELVSGDKITCANSGESFPPYEKVIPEPRKKGATGCAVVGVQPKYLGDVAKAARHLASGGVEWSVAGDRDPIRIDLRNPDLGIESTIVIMPMRV